MKKNDFYKFIPKDRLKEILDTERLPCYVYFGEIIQKQYDKLKFCLPDGFQVNYAFKANPNRDVINFIQSLGIGADVGSMGELAMATEAGFSPEEIEFTGPGKTTRELETAITTGISSINAESVSEIHKISLLCKEKKKRANVGIRLNPRYRSSFSAIKMNENTQFGIIEDDIEKAFDIILQNKEFLDFKGFHLHLGSQIMKTEGIVSNFRFIMEKTSGIVKSFNLMAEKVNFGGGWGVGMFGEDDKLDYAVIKRELADIFSAPEYKSVFENTRFIVEPGRFLVAEGGIYAVPVIYKKRGYEKVYLIVEGGMHQHFAAAGGIGQIIKRNYEIDVLQNFDNCGEDLAEYTVAGNLCLPADILANNIKLRSSVREGDTLVFFNSGAYAFSASPLSFLSHSLPAELFV